MSSALLHLSLRRISRIAVSIVLVCIGWFPSELRADAVDDAFASGLEAAQSDAWPTAIANYERARALLPGRSAILEYNLGTAYAEVGDLGFATVHLRRSLQTAASPDPQVADAARRNLGIVRHRAEIAASANQRTLTEPERWTELVGAVLASRPSGYIALVLVYLTGILIVLRQHVVSIRRRVHRALVGTCIGVAVLTTSLHMLALGESYDAGVAIVVGDDAALREGPGGHRPEVAKIQASSRVRVLEHSTGWSRVRLPGGLEGWLPRRSLVSLEGPSSKIRASHKDRGDGSDPTALARPAADKKRI